jgi:hypothetical protein
MALTTSTGKRVNRLKELKAAIDAARESPHPEGTMNGVRFEE